MSGWLLLAIWLVNSALTYVQFKRVLRRERSNPDLLFNNPKMLVAFNVLLNTQAGHVLVIIASIVPVFWVMMAIDLMQNKGK